MSRSSVVPPAGLTDPWLASVWRAFRAKSLSLSHLGIPVALHEAAASGGATGAQLSEQTGIPRASVSLALSRARALGRCTGVDWPRASSVPPLRSHE